MNLLVALHGPEPVATLGWLVGVLAGLAFDVGLIFVIGSTPRLREHGGAPPVKPRSKVLLRIPVVLIATVWVVGFWLGGHAAPLCYAVYSSFAAAIVIGAVLLLVMGTAANHVASRSIW